LGAPVNSLDAELVRHGEDEGGGGGGSKLRVAVLSSISWRTPPRHYGPWELFASLLTEGLVALGHEVTLFATGDSETSARLVSTSPTGWSETEGVDTKVAECLHIASVFERAEEFDIIHNSFDFLPLTYSRLTPTPVVTTVHGFSSEAIVPVYQQYNDVGHYVAISDADRHPALHYAATIHHGIDLMQFELSVAPGTYLLFFGRIHPHKGTAEAIAVARMCGLPLVIAGIVHDDDYFRTEIEPHIDGTNVTFVGAVGGRERSRLLGGAIALLHLIDFDEPFGFSVVEAMACGTPVVAYRRGSMPELITDATGALANDRRTAVEAVARVSGLDRHAIRTQAEERFDVGLMAQRYVAVYRTALAARAR
jgi:glycosyltransferase involved in cell wall biosynthesis